MQKNLIDNVRLFGNNPSHFSEILTPEALSFVVKLHREFNPVRKKLLVLRKTRQKKIDSGEMFDFLPETAQIRNDPAWRVAPAPANLVQRRVEITGPTERKMLINALNSGADVFMADFEDSLSPTWSNIIEGQANLLQAIDKTISYSSPEGKSYSLKPKTATLMVRPRGWHLNEKNLLIDGEAVSASLFDFGLYFFHNAQRLIDQGAGPYFYLPKLESHLEARLWNDVFLFAEKEMFFDEGTIRATVLIETIPAAFEMEEILYELRTHSAGLNAGRWDYIFSIIKKFQKTSNWVFPDRSQITMTVPFMRAYTELLVKSCHRRGAHAIGGMAAFIPTRKDPQINEIALEKVREDKLRESKDGFDGTWVAHPDLVPIAMDVFKNALGTNPNQLSKSREEVHITPAELTNFNIPGGKITEKGVRQNIIVAILYLDSWLKGTGAAALFNLMEDAATAEISRAQVWQWIHHHAHLDDGRKVTLELCQQWIQEEIQKSPEAMKMTEARKLFEKLISPRDFEDFLTLLAYPELEDVYKFRAG